MNTTQEYKIHPDGCLALLPSIKSNSIDMILTDLPYGITENSWDIIIPFEPLWKEYERIIKNTGAIVLTSMQPFTSMLIMSNIKLFKYCWIWKKTNCGNLFNCKNAPMKNYEDICVFSKSNIANNSLLMTYYPQETIKIDKIKINRQGIKGSTKGYRPSRINESVFIQEFTNYPKQVLEFNSVINAIHPTQKPVALFEYLIKTYTNEGDTAHDSCLGSGTTLEACARTNRNCIGHEKLHDWESEYPKRIASGRAYYEQFIEQKDSMFNF